MIMKKKQCKWTVLSTDQKLQSGYVWCKCACGVEKSVNKYHLRDGKSTSCGACGINLVGTKYGKLKVLEKAEPHQINGKNHSNKWKCECECGKMIVRVTSSLIRNKDNKEYCCGDPACKFERGIAAFNQLLSTYKRVAKKKKIEFSLSNDEFKSLTSSPCVYCLTPPSTTKKNRHNNGDYIYNGINRVDPSKGYTTSNAVSCCKYCNSAKLDRSVNEFLKWAKKLLQTPVWEKKCWGRAWHRFNDKHLNESLLEVNKGWQCSIHWHTNRWNCFTCIDAIIGVEDFGPAKHKPTLVSTHIIKEGDSFLVQPERWHRFYTIQSGRLVEIYWTTNGQDCEIDDINRWDIGGKQQIYSPTASG